MLLSSLTRERMAIVIKGHVEIPSDLQGIIRFHFNDHIREIVPKLAQRLKEADFDVTANQIASAAHIEIMAFSRGKWFGLKLDWCHEFPYAEAFCESFDQKLRRANGCQEYDRRADIHEAFLSLGCALIFWRCLRKTWTAA